MFRSGVGVKNFRLRTPLAQTQIFIVQWQAKFLTSCHVRNAYAQSNILHIKYAGK